jgi:hypothetical protein
MLFDLKSGKRRRVIQVVFGFLAFIFFISFVGFGIGSDVSGGIFDAIGLGGDDTSSTPQYDQQIEDAEATLETDPANERALLDLVNYRYLAATESEDGVRVDPSTGVAEVSSGARSDLVQALDAWNRYLDTKPKPVNADAAVDVLQINDILFRAALGTGDASEALSSAEEAAAAGRIAAESRDTASDWGAVANYAYIAGDVKLGDEAAKRAIGATEPSTRKQIEQAMKSTAKNGEALNKELEKRIKQGGGEGAIEDPFGGLGGAESGLPAPTAP